METTLTKRTLTSAVVEVAMATQNGANPYKATIRITKADHNLLIGGWVKIKLSGLNVIAVDTSAGTVNDFFNQERLFYVNNSSTLTCSIDINSSAFTNDFVVVGGVPLVQVNNDKITLTEGSYNFELLNKADYPALRTWDTNYIFRLKEYGIGSAKAYNGASDYYSDGTNTSIPDLNEQDLTFRFCENAEIAITDQNGNTIPSNDFTKTTNIAIIINKL